MKLRREWITPFSAGMFLISAVTGVMLFFHLGVGLTHGVHEWISWALLAGVALHLAVNFAAIKKFLLNARGLAILSCCCVVLLFSSFSSGGGKGGSATGVMVDRLTGVPLTTLAQVAGVEVEQLRARLSEAGLTWQSDEQSLRDLVGGDRGRLMHLLGELLAR